MPKDDSVKEFGGLIMTEQDERKLMAAYGCSGCGGSHLGEKGEIGIKLGDKECEWLITVKEGSVIELNIEKFNVSLQLSVYFKKTCNCICASQIPDCSDGKLTLYEGYKQLGEMREEFCGSNVPAKTITSGTNSITLAIEFAEAKQKRKGRQKNREAIQFSAKWKRKSGEELNQNKCCKFTK